MMRELVVTGPVGTGREFVLEVALDQGWYRGETRAATMELLLRLTAVAGTIAVLVYFLLELLATRHLVALADAIGRDRPGAEGALRLERQWWEWRDELDDVVAAYNALGTRLGTATDGLRERERRFRAIADNAVDAFVTVDRGGDVVYWNDAAARLFGRQADEALGRPAAHVFDTADGDSTGLRLFGHDLEAVSTPAVLRNVEVGTSDGRRLPVEVSLAWWDGADGRFVNAIIRDVSARKKAEAELRRSLALQSTVTQLLREALSSMPLRDCVRAALRRLVQTGVSPEAGASFLLFDRGGDLLYLAETTLSDPAAFARLEAEARKRIRSGALPRPGHVTLVDDGRRSPACRLAGFDVRHDMVCILAWSGGVDEAAIAEGLAGTLGSAFAAVIAHKYGEEEHARLLSIIDAAPDLIAVTDQAGSVIHINRWGRECLEAHGLRYRPMMPLTDLYTEDSAERLIYEAIPAAGHTGLWTGQAELAGPDGRPVPVQQTIIAHRDGDGRLMYFSTIAHDISDLVEAQQRARLLARAIEQSPAAVLITDPQGHIEYVNPRFSALTGYSQAEVAGRTPRVIRSGETPDDVYRDLWSTIRSGREWRGELLNRRRDGSTYWASTLISPVSDEFGGVVNFVGVQQDVTAAKEEEARRRESQKMEAVGLLAGGIAHDFNNVLAGIMGHAQLIRGEAEVGSETWQDSERIRLAVLRAKEMVGQLLTFSRRSDEVDKRPVSLAEVIEEVLLLLRASVPASIELQSDLRTSSGTIMALPHQLHQVLINLVTNARDAIPGEVGTVRIGLEDVLVETPLTWACGAVPAGRYVRLSVCDSGQGIAETHLEKLFLPFFTTKEVGQGTGLGLAVVHGIVTDHSGHLRVTSTPGEGACFEAYFPRADTMAPTALDAPEGADELGGGGETVLLVDDEECVVQPMARALARFGYVPVVFASAVDALEAVRTRRVAPDVVMSDLMMPDMMGDTFARQLKALLPAVPVVLCTGRAGDYARSVARLREGGFDACLVKPCELAEILTILRRMCGHDGADGAKEAGFPHATPV